MQSLEAGSIIKRRLNGFWGLFYYHMGIYVGNGQVIHFSGENKKEKCARIILSSVESFLQGYSLIVHAKPKNQKHAEAVVQKAKNVFYNFCNSYNNKYNVINNNCENFVIICYEVGY